MPAEHYVKGLEEKFILATKYPPKFTMGQMIGNAKAAMEKCGLFRLYLNKWKGYKNLLISGRGMGVPGTITNTQELSNEEDDSITTITDVMSNVMGTM